MTKDRHVYIDILGIGIVALIFAIACQSITPRKYLRAIADNDAVGYATAAKSLAETGKLTSHIIYPSTLSQNAPKSTLYMPGLYFALAAVYKVFHFGTSQSLLVPRAAYLIAAICTYLLGQKAFDRLTGIVAAGLFLIYPPNLYFSAAVMTELPLAAAAVAALCIFIHLPRRWMHFIGPALLILPFLFRETGAFMALPMGLILLFQPKGDGTTFRSNVARASIFLALSIVVLGAVYFSPLSAGRPSLLKLDIFIQERGAERIYRDTLAFDKLQPTGAEWARTLGTRSIANIKKLAWRCATQQRDFVVIALFPLIAAIPLGLAWGWIKRDPLALGAALLVLLTLGFVCMFYIVQHDRPLRVALFAFPLVALLEARLALALVAAGRSRVPVTFRPWLLGIIVSGIAAWVGAMSFKGFSSMTANDVADEMGSRFITFLNVPELEIQGKETMPVATHLLVAPHLLGVPYLIHHPWITYSFVPANRQTLNQLCAKYPVNTLIFRPEDALDLTEADILAQGLYLWRACEVAGMHYRVFRRPAFAGEQAGWIVTGEESFSWTPRAGMQY